MQRRAGRDRQDYSTIWRPAIEEHEQNLPDSSVADVLISLLRDVSQRGVEGDRARLPRLLEILETETAGSGFMAGLRYTYSVSLATHRRPSWRSG